MEYRMDKELPLAPERSFQKVSIGLLWKEWPVDKTICEHDRQWCVRINDSLATLREWDFRKYGHIQTYDVEICIRNNIVNESNLRVTFSIQGRDFDLAREKATAIINALELEGE